MNFQKESTYQPKKARRIRGRFTLFTLATLLALFSLVTTSALGAPALQDTTPPDASQEGGTPTAPEPDSGVGIAEEVPGAAVILDLPLQAPDGPVPMAATPEELAQETLQPDAFPVVWGTSRIDAPNRFANLTDRTLKFDRNNVAYFAYGGDYLYVSWYDGSFHTTKVDLSLGVGQFASLDIDRNNRVHVSYYDTVNGALKYAYYNGSVWSVSTVATAVMAASLAAEDPESAELPGEQPAAEDAVLSLNLDEVGEVAPVSPGASPAEALQANRSSGPNMATLGGGVGLYSSIAVDSDGDPYISHYDSRFGNLLLTYREGSTWRTRILDSRGDVGTFTSIALDSNNRPSISYMDEDNDNLKWAHDNGSRWVLETVDNGTNVGAYSSIALDDGGNPHISYYDFGTDKLDLKYAARSSSGTWTIRTIDSNGDVGAFTSIVADASWNFRISYYDATRQQVKYAVQSSAGTWTTSAVTASNERISYTSIARDRSGNVGIAYYHEGTGSLRYANLRTSWTIRGVDNAYDVGFRPSMETGSNGVSYISYYDDAQNDLRFISNPSNNWQPFALASAGDVGSYNSLELDSQNRPHIIFYDQTNGDVRYAVWNGSNWVFSNIDTSAGKDVGRYVSLALNTSNEQLAAYYNATDRDLKFDHQSLLPQTIDSNNDVGLYTSITSLNLAPWISYYDATNRDLKVAHYDAAQARWVAETVDGFGSHEAGLYTSIDSDPTGAIHVAYYDLTNRDLRYARWTATTGWQRQTVDGIGRDVGLNPSIKVAVDGTVHISYYDATSGDLKYANGRLGNWTLQVVDSTFDVGLYSSVALDSSGRPNIAYYDRTFGDLKFARGIRAVRTIYFPVVRK